MSENPSTPPRGDASPSTSGGAAPDAENADELALREKVRELTAGVLGGQRIDPQAVEEVTRAVLGKQGPEVEVERDERRALVEALAEVDDALMRSAGAAHDALQRLIALGPEFGENDLKEVFAQLQSLQAAYVRIAERVAKATSGTLEQELRQLAAQAQRVSADAGARAANLMTELGQRIGTGYRETSSEGFETARRYGVRMSMLASGVLAGIADALRDYAAPGPREPKE